MSILVALVIYKQSDAERSVCAATSRKLPVLHILQLARGGLRHQRIVGGP